jgi:hypothetical protein
LNAGLTISLEKNYVAKSKEVKTESSLTDLQMRPVAQKLLLNNDDDYNDDDDDDDDDIHIC